MLSDAKINANYLAYLKRLEKYGCYSEEMINDIGEDIKNASFSMQEDSGSSYKGSMIDAVLNSLCKIAYNINENGFGAASKDNSMAHPYLKVNFDMLMRVLLLQHIGKAQMFVEETDNWKKTKRGYNYDFNNDLPANLKMGERSLYLCQKYGISLAEEEYEAIRIVDKVDDGKGDYYASPLAVITKFVNMLAAIELKLKYQNKNTKEKVEQ